MIFHKGFLFVCLFSLTAAGAAFGSPMSSNGADAGAAAGEVSNAEAPIGFERSARVHHKSKMHHVRIKMDQHETLVD
jgi:hypothetical protein